VQPVDSVKPAKIPSKGKSNPRFSNPYPPI
jgi:hypothetical protein